MEWLTNHYVEIFAIIGAVYSLARLIVNLTPTPADNAALDKVAGFLKVVGKVFGFDLTQGVNTLPVYTKKNKGNATVVLLLFITLIVPIGCATYQDIHKDPRAECVAAQETFAAIVRSLTTLRENDAFDDYTIEKISILINEGKDALNGWYSKVLAEIPVDTEDKSVFQSIMKRLTVYEKGVK